MIVEENWAKSYFKPIIRIFFFSLKGRDEDVRKIYFIVAIYREKLECFFRDKNFEGKKEIRTFRSKKGTTIGWPKCTLEKYFAEIKSRELSTTFQEISNVSEKILFYKMYSDRIKSIKSRHPREIQFKKLIPGIFHSSRSIPVDFSPIRV